MISIKNLSKSHGDTAVYSGFNLDIEEGKIICLLGESGCGKTTLLNILAGLTDYSGEVPRLKTSYVFQSPRLVPNLTVGENLKLIGAKESDILYMLSSVGLSGFSGRYPKELSGGQAQRVALCRAFLFDSELMLLDEPFSSLDLKLRISVMQVFLKLRAKKPVTTLFVTHDIEEALYLSDRIIVLKSGGICGDFENTPLTSYGGESPLRRPLTELIIK